MSSPKKKEKIELPSTESYTLVDCENITDDYIEEWIIVTKKVLVILAEENKENYKKIYQDFIYDLQELKNARRITEEDYEDILENL